MDPGKIGDDYQLHTKYHRDRPFPPVDNPQRPPAARRHPDAAKKVDLPAPECDAGPGLWGVLNGRRSERSYTAEPLSASRLAQLLWAVEGVTAVRGPHLLRTTPSAGALYPQDTYLVVNNVAGLARGLYHYDVADASLWLLREEDLRERIAAAALDQKMCARAAVVFAWTAIVQRSKWKYGQRAYRYIYLDAGHLGENLHLAAAAMGLGCCAIGALYDDEVNAIVGAGGIEETVVYMSCVGNV